MIDIQNNIDDRGVSLHWVGIKDYTLQVVINNQHTIANVQLGVSLDATHKGIHMSRLSQLLQDFHILNNETVIDLLNRSKELLESSTSSIIINTTYFRKKNAPVSGLSGTINYSINIFASLSSSNRSIYHSICVPITAVCPCSKAISSYGAHNQRGAIQITLSDIDIDDYDNVIRIIEKQASSCEVYSVLKRTDEKKVTEKAYENAKFVEDIVRDSIIALKPIYGCKLCSVECINFESIHNHNAFAYYYENEKFNMIR